MGKRAGIECGVINLGALPEGCIANILSFTTPWDACRLSLVSPIFRSAAGSDAVWEKFLPSDYQTILSQAVDDSSSLTFSSKKDLYFSLSDNPILIDEGKKSFSLDQRSGKKCYMLAARDITIVWGDTPSYWKWISLPESRFKEVAELIYVWWLELRGKINTRMLSPGTNYVAYLVFKMRKEAHGFDVYPEEVSVEIVGGESHTNEICMDPAGPHSKERKDGWLEIKLGEFFNEYGDDGELIMSLMEVKAGITKGGLIVQGIEIRPK